MKKVIPDDAVLVPDSAELKFKGEIFDVYQWPQTMFDGSLANFEMLKRTDTVSVLCVVDGKILLLDDEQPHLGVRQTFPAGQVDTDDSSILAAAKREVLEETGHSFTSWRLIKVWQPYRKIEWFVNVWLAWDVAGSQAPKLDVGEKITVHKLDFQTVKQKVMSQHDYLGENFSIFEKIDNIEQLLELPEFTGQTVDR